MGKSERKKPKRSQSDILGVSKKEKKMQSERNLEDTKKEKKKPKRSQSDILGVSKKDRKKERKVQSERNLEDTKKEKKKKDRKLQSERNLDAKKEKKKPKRSKSEMIPVKKKSKKKEERPKSDRSLGEFVSRSFKVGFASIKEGGSLLLDNISNHTDPSFVKGEKAKGEKMSKSERKIMKPKPGQKFVEFCKSGDDESCGLVLEVKGNFVFVKSVEQPAPSHNSHPKDRIIALNGKKIEDYNKDMKLITATLESGKPIRLVIDPTMLR